MSLENTRDIGTAKVVMVGGGGGSGTTNYNNLTNKPQINSVELLGNKSLSDIGIEANPSSTGSTNLTKLKVGGTTYNVPNGTTNYNDLSNRPQINSVTLSGNKSLSDIGIEANPSSSGSTDLTKLKVGSTTYNIPSGGGSDVTGNPSSTATSYLEKIKIGNTTYDTSSIIPLFATGITSNLISISATNFAQLENRAVAIYTGSVSGTTQTHWILYINNSEVAIVDESGVAYSADIEAGTIILATIASVGSVMTATVVGVVGYPDPLAIEHGGTGNKVGYIQTGKKSNTTLGNCATAEGYDNTASGNFSHAEGRSTTAGNYSHAEGYGTNAGAGANHAEGENTTASGYNCHAEGANTTSSNTCTHAEGFQTTASGTYSHAGGRGTVAGYSTQTAIGKWNDNKSDTLFEVGNGTSTSSKSNAFEVYSDGKISCDNGSSKFQFTQSGGADGYYDASGTFHAFGSGGSGNTKVKTLYGLYASSWSSAPNSDGFYTAQVTLNPTLNPDVTPDILLAGSSASAQPTNTYRTMFSYVERGYMSGSTLTLYAKTKPTSLFKFWVEGVSGSGSLAVACNVIQPNGAVSGGGFNLTLIYTLTKTKADFTSQGTYYSVGDSAQITGNLLYIEVLYRASGTNQFRLVQSHLAKMSSLPINILNPTSLADPTQMRGFYLQADWFEFDISSALYNVMQTDSTYTVNIYRIN